MKGCETMGKNLVAYFSPTGTTKKAAQKLAGLTGADLYEIRPEIMLKPMIQSLLDSQFGGIQHRLLSRHLLRHMIFPERLSYSLQHPVGQM